MRSSLKRQALWWSNTNWPTPPHACDTHLCACVCHTLWPCLREHADSITNRICCTLDNAEHVPQQQQQRAHSVCILHVAAHHRERVKRPFMQMYTLAMPQIGYTRICFIFFIRTRYATAKKNNKRKPKLTAHTVHFQLCVCVLLILLLLTRHWFWKAHESNINWCIRQPPTHHPLAYLQNLPAV